MRETRFRGILSVGILDSLVKIFVYYFHERIWTGIALGKIVHPLAELNFSKELADEHGMLIRRQLEERGYFEQRHGEP